MAAPVGPYSPHYRIGNLIAISGQLGLVDGVLADGFDAQVDAVLANLADQLEQAGLSKSDVIKTMQLPVWPSCGWVWVRLVATPLLDKSWV